MDLPTGLSNFKDSGISPAGRSPKSVSLSLENWSLSLLATLALVFCFERSLEPREVKVALFCLDKPARRGRSLLNLLSILFFVSF